MNNWTRTGPVVAEVDGSTRGLCVVDYAGREARRAGADLVLVAPYHNHVVSSSMPVDEPESPSAGAEQILRDAATQVRHRYGGDLGIILLAREGSRLKVLQEASRQARVLVVARDHDSGSGGFASAQGNLGLAGRTGCPVIVVPPRWRPTVTEGTVAVGIDGTHLSLEAVEFAFRTAAGRGGELTVVHSHQLAYRPLAAADGTWQERADLTVSETLAGWDEEYPNVNVTRLLTTRPVVSALARASAQVGLIVIGAHAGPLPIGDPVARQTIARMPCPVAIVAHHVTAAERDQRRREIQPRSDVSMAH